MEINKNQLGQNLIKACIYEDINKINKLISQNPNFNVVDHNDRSALIWACINSNTEIVNLLLQAGAGVSLSKKDCSERTALSWAELRKNTEIIQLLENAVQQSTENYIKGGFKNNDYLKKYLKYKTKYSKLK